MAGFDSVLRAGSNRLMFAEALPKTDINVAKHRKTHPVLDVKVFPYSREGKIVSWASQTLLKSKCILANIYKKKN